MKLKIQLIALLVTGLYLGVANIVFDFRNPKFNRGNSYQFFKEVGNILTFQKLDKYQ